MVGAMSEDRRLSPVELLRQLTLAIERLAVQGLASGAVRGATDELRAGMPEFDGQVQELLQDVLTILGRMAQEAAERPAYPPGTWPRLVAEAAVQGAIEELRRSLPRLDALSKELLDRVNALLDRSAEVAASRRSDLLKPGSRARLTAAGVVEGALRELQQAMPMLAPLTAELASQAGGGFVAGIGSKAEERVEAFTALLDRAGRSLVHALVDQLDTELKARWGAAGVDASGAAAAVAERAAVASVRGASEELVRQVRSVSSGMLSSLGRRLRKPAILAAGTSSALLLVALFVSKVR